MGATLYCYYMRLFSKVNISKLFLLPIAANCDQLQERKTKPFGLVFLSYFFVLSIIATASCRVISPCGALPSVTPAAFAASHAPFAQLDTLLAR